MASKEVEDKKPDNETEKPPVKSVESKAMNEQESKVMNALEAFKSLEPSMGNMLELSINEFAQKLWGKGLIPDSVHEIIFDEGAGKGSRIRSYNFLMSIYKKAYVAKKKELGKHKKIINAVADIIGDDAALRGAAETLRNCELDDLKEEMDDIAKAIQGTMNTIAASAFSQDLISAEQHHEITDPSANHSVHCTRAVLDAVRATIAANPSKMETFIGILIDMGPPISDFAFKLRMALQKPLSPDK